MKRRMLLGLAGAAGTLAAAGLPTPFLAASGDDTAAPESFRDPVSGHLVRRLSRRPGSHVLYFHDNAFTADGRYMVYDAPGGVDVVDMASFEAQPLIEGPYECMMVSRQKNIAYVYRKNDEGGGKGVSGLDYFAVSIPDGKVTQIAERLDGSLFQSNADDSLMLGVWQERPFDLQPGPKVAGTDGGYNAVGPDGKPLSFAAAKEVRMAERLAQGIPMEIFTLDPETGERRTVVRSDKDWLNHIQFSPTDPDQIMYCHEGPWHMVDRIWTVRSDGSDNRRIHRRRMNMEIAGHEFFSYDGKRIWYDLQTPRGEDFWLASVDLDSGSRIWRHMDRNAWSVHFMVDRDGRLGGDGGGPDMVAEAPDGKWLYLYDEEIIEDLGVSAPDAADLVRPARLIPQKIVDMSAHDYRLEPNVQFSADGAWLSFKSNMHGDIHVYAVETGRSA
ncbi:oligogalacturonate lyase family protein [Mangrovicoccus algicola]|uniref:Oligogalacturonate lyase n=1 Tax=Mangrovicoccus algicola TaxID=2771008 RepID=A0A8J6Z597_9RHOB|nr:oligogalacturonate lyase family protein [Mangrovicoccus algicola]MBE3637944.1 oligogalacturonate lyase [Mangrovicoccus algicola]